MHPTLFTHLRNIIQLHSREDALPADRTRLDATRTRQTRNYMSAIVKRRIGALVPANAAQALRLLRILPVRDALAELLVVLPAANVRVAGGRLDEGAAAVLLVSDPVAVVRVAVLERVQAVAVALGQPECTFVRCATVVDAAAVAVAVAILDLAFVVLG